MRFYITLLLSVISFVAAAQPKPKVIVECTIEFAEHKDEASSADSIKRTAIAVYIKNNLSRVDYITSAFIQKKIFDSKRNVGVILQELGNTKVLRNLDSLKWVALNKRYENAVVTQSDEKKMILEYECKKATIVLKDSTKLNVFYAPAIIPSTRAYEYQFKDVPGFVLEYETINTGSNKRMIYTATKLNLSPVPVSRFEIPKSGYRVMN